MLGGYCENSKGLCEYGVPQKIGLENPVRLTGRLNKWSKEEEKEEKNTLKYLDWVT